VCDHFEGKWKAHYLDLEASLNDSGNSEGTSLCEYVDQAAGGATGFMCTKLLEVVAEVRHQEPPEKC